MVFENKIIIFGAGAMELYLFLVGTVIASAVIPTLIANKFFLPKHLLQEPILDDQPPEIMPKHK
jgi:hypothetical protein